MLLTSPLITSAPINVKYYVIFGNVFLACPEGEGECECLWEDATEEYMEMEENRWRKGDGEE